jgi:hypothetical protein
MQSFLKKFGPKRVRESEGIINITKAVDITTFESHKRKFAFLYSEDDLGDDQSPPTKK